MQFTSIRRSSREAEAAGSWDSLQASAPWFSVPSEAACLSSPACCPSACLSLRGLLLAVRPLVSLRRAPWACLWVWALLGGAPGKGTPLPKHVNPLLTKRKGFQGPSWLEEGSGGWGCPFENLNSDGCQFNKGFPDSGPGALGTGPCRGTPLERPLGGCCLVTWPSIHWAPLGAPRLLSRDNAGPRTKAGSSPQGPSSSPLPLCSWQ